MSGRWGFWVCLVGICALIALAAAGSANAAFPDGQLDSRLVVDNPGAIELTPVWAEQNSIVYTMYAHPFYNLYATDLRGRARGLGPADAEEPDVSPTGRIAFTAFTRIFPDYRDDIWVQEPDGTTTRLTEPSASNTGDYFRHASWSPDGAQIVFSKQEVGESDYELAVMAATPGAPIVPITNNAVDDTAPDWSSQNEITFVRNGRIMAVNADGTGERQLTDGTLPASFPRWSPDGERIAFETRQSPSTTADIALINRDGTGFRNLTQTQTAEESAPAWAPDGSGLAFSYNGIRVIGPADSPIYDGTPPATLGLLGPAPGALLATARPTVSWVASSDEGGSGIDHYEVTFDTSSAVTVPAGTTSATPATDLPDGDRTWTVTAVDAAGNRRVSEQRAFRVDTLPPDTAFTGGPPNLVDGRTRKTTAAFTLTSPLDSTDTLQCSLDDATFTACGSPSNLTGVGAGAHTFRMRAIDAAGNADPSPATYSWTVDHTTPPAAVLTLGDAAVARGETLTMSAAGSSDPLDGDIVEYAWDTNGDGVFDRTTAVPSLQFVAAQTGTFAVRLRVTVEGGATDTAQQTLRVLPEPPAGEVGVSIDGGARYARSRAVQLSLVWPKRASEVLIANDGGFASATPVELSATADWTLESAGSDRLPQTVYVRFRGPGGAATTYTDDIVLDTQAPQLRSARAWRHHGRLVLTVKAHDEVSGVQGMQVTTRRARPGALVSAGRRVVLHTRRRHAFVRVHDHAGNVSSWRRVRAPG